MNNISFIQFIDTNNTQYTVPTHMILLEHWRHDTDPEGCMVVIGSTDIHVSWKTYNQILKTISKLYTTKYCNAGS